MPPKKNPPPTAPASKAAPARAAPAAASAAKAKTQKAAQAAPAPAEAREQGAAGALDAVMARLEDLGRGLGGIAQLRADVQGLSRRIDDLAALVAGQGQAPAASAAPAAPERDPGDAVPPGVAVQDPAPLTPGDEAVLHTLEEMPKRAARPRAKAGGRSRR